MFDFAQKRKIRAFLYHKATLVVLFIAVIFFARSTWLVWQKKRASEGARMVALAHLTELEAHDQDLESHVEKLKTPRGVEDEIRSKFSVVKGGESVVVVVPASVQPLATTTPAGFWQKIKSFFSKP